MKSFSIPFKIEIEKNVRSSDDGLAGHVALSNHHLLGQEHFLSGDFHAKVATSNHDGIGSVKDLIEILQAFLVFDLGNDLDVATAGSHQVANVMDIIGALHE